MQFCLGAFNEEKRKIGELREHSSLCTMRSNYAQSSPWEQWGEWGFNRIIVSGHNWMEAHH